MRVAFVALLLGTPAVAEGVTVRGETVLPAAFTAALDPAAAPGDLSIPGSMLSYAEVTRPRAQVRAGPGTQFEVEDQVLAQGTEVLVLKASGVWRKVLVPGTWRKGWVHHQALAARPFGDAAANRALTIDASVLPTVLAVRPIGEALTYPAKASVKVAIPKGAMFRSLMDDDSATLVLLPETNSVLWISRKDVQ